MAKKSKKKGPSKSIAVSEHPNYQDPQQLEHMVKRRFEQMHSIMGTVSERGSAVYAQADYDAVHRRRRAAAAKQYAPKVSVLVSDFCADIPDVFYVAEEWADINALPLSTYDMEEDYYGLLLGAVVWILDHIEANGRMADTIALLADVEDPGDGAYLRGVWDPSHSEAVMEATLGVLQQRDQDCTGLTPSNSKRRKYQSSTQIALESRYFMDAYTASGKQDQNVPSRHRFEALLALLDETDVSNAVRYFEDKLWEWVVCYFRCRAVFLKEEQILDQKATQFQQDMEKRIDSLTQQTNLRKSVPFALSNSFPEMPPQATLSAASSQNLLGAPLQLLVEFEAQSERINAELEKIKDRIQGFTTDSLMFCTMPYERICRDYGQEIADTVASFHIDEPYVLCFALLCLIDRGSDLPWLYYPGCVLARNAAARLPWFAEEYDDICDPFWNEWEGHSAVPPKNVPESLDWYSLDYIYKNSDLNFRQRSNLAQIVYEQTGCLIPRNLHRYDPAVRELRRYGITGKKLQSQLLSCMLLLGESRHRGNDQMYPMEPEFLTEVESEPDGSEPASDVEQALREELKILQQENKRLRTAAYEAGRELQQLQKRGETQYQQWQRDRQELTDLRNIVFSQQNSAETGASTEDQQIQLPYSVRQRTVVFGGHDTWRKAIKPMLSGDVRFVDRDMQPDPNLIRHASVVWIQPNSLSHKFYYGIMDTARKHKIPVRYFTFASAEKCARQLAENDQNLQ